MIDLFSLYSIDKQINTNKITKPLVMILETIL